eukprot:CAMPEP_0202079348 /NCGR_PEP_ID=MMETSP0964-20121228/6436_1 /ASSEMBLY_ACC=CAM_ASM_000500 /TAXON_ID=4773 /ORGANISM="Schizochytrium aggregatum, Strain ATCC28209" /LENGTH=383 /DNA_ID=CAMNT_0048646683 /DNA_START=158 /DNA_END=1305 /DNA_ORIENTATION=+
MHASAEQEEAASHAKNEASLVEGTRETEERLGTGGVAVATGELYGGPAGVVGQGAIRPEIKDELDALGATVSRGIHERRTSTVASYIDVATQYGPGAGRGEHGAQRGRMARASREVHRRAALLAGQKRVGADLQERQGELAVARARRDRQRGAAFRASQVEVHAALREQDDGVGVARGSSVVQRAEARGVHRRGVRAEAEQQGDEVGLAVGRGIDQRGHPVHVARVDVRARLRERRDDVRGAGVGGPGHGRAAGAVAYLELGAAAQEAAHDAGMAEPRGEHERGLPLGPHAVHVAALGGHPRVDARGVPVAARAHQLVALGPAAAARIAPAPLRAGIVRARPARRDVRAAMASAVALASARLAAVLVAAATVAAAAAAAAAAA